MAMPMAWSASWAFSRMTDARVQVGRDFGRSLVFVSAGYTDANFNAGFFGPMPYRGWNAGIGADVMVSRHAMLGIEYVYRSLDSTAWGGSARFGAVQLRAALRF